MNVYFDALVNIRLAALSNQFKNATVPMLNPLDIDVQKFFAYYRNVEPYDLTYEMLTNQQNIKEVQDYKIWVKSGSDQKDSRWGEGGTMKNPNIAQLPTTATGDFQSGTQTAPNPITYGDVLKNIQGLGMFQSGSSAINQALAEEYKLQINTRLQKGEKIEDIIKFLQGANIADKSSLEQLVTYATYGDYKRSITNMVNRGDKIDDIKEFIYSLPILGIEKDEFIDYATKAISDKATVEKIGAFGGNPAAYAAQEIKKAQNPVALATLVKTTIKSQILEAAYPYANKLGFTNVEDEHKARKQLSEEERQQKIKELWDIAKDAAFFALAIL